MIVWAQHQLTLPPVQRGFHLITDHISRHVPELGRIDVGMMNIFLQHTSASLSINENADPDVRADLEMTMTSIVSEQLPFIHTLEGPDDMPAHVKSSLLGCSLLIPIGGGRPLLGTWQGIYICEHRNRATARRLIITAWGTEST